MNRATVSVSVPDDADPFPAAFPIALQLEFTSRCQLRCRMCPLTTGTSSSSRSPGPMHEALFEEVLAIARRCRSVILAGYGEPLTNPQCLPMLRALDAEGVQVALATNGIALTRQVAEQLVALEHLVLINVSIDSPDPAVYLEVRGGNVERPMQGLANLMAVVDDPDRVVVSSVAMATNLPSLVHFPALLAEMGVKRYSLQAVMDYTDYAQEHSLLDHAELEALLHAVEANCAANAIDLELSVPTRTRADFADPDAARARFYGSGDWDEHLTRQCHVAWDIPFIDKDGRVFACCFAGSADTRQLGQLGPQTFDEIWTGPAFRQFRKDIVDGATTPDICRRCSVAPLGEHLFKAWAAVVAASSARVVDDASAIVSLTVLNTGARPWDAEHPLRVATSAPRDTDTSPLRHPGWLSPNRAATMREDTVAPGETATLEFPVSLPRSDAAGAEFELVVEGMSWLPNTRIGVGVHGRRRAVRHTRVAAVYRRSLPRPVRRWVARAGTHRPFRH